MTSSYLVLDAAPGGTDVTHEKTRAIRDGFTLLGFLFPWLWLLVHRLWLLCDCGVPASGGSAAF